MAAPCAWRVGVRGREGKGWWCLQTDVDKRSFEILLKMDFELVTAEEAALLDMTDILRIQFTATIHMVEKAIWLSARKNLQQKFKLDPRLKPCIPASHLNCAAHDLNNAGKQLQQTAGEPNLAGGVLDRKTVVDDPRNSNNSLSTSSILPLSTAFERSQYQKTINEILERSDVEFVGGKRIVKRSGWRKLAFAFNVSFEMRSEDIERDREGNNTTSSNKASSEVMSGNVTYAKFVHRAILPNGRFADAWGACDAREKRFMKPNHDVPATAETRAKNRACADLFGIGESKR
eukprot:554889-Hanusia_phi.AAC.6